MAAALVLAAAAERALAQEETPASTPRAAQARTRATAPTTIPHTQPAGKSKPGPGATPPKPTVELKPGEVPAISFAEPNWDFGRVKAGDDITHEFVFTNTGTGPLEILEVRPG